MPLVSALIPTEPDIRRCTTFDLNTGTERRSTSHAAVKQDNVVFNCQLGGIQNSLSTVDSQITRDNHVARKGLRCSIQKCNLIIITRVVYLIRANIELAISTKSKLSVGRVITILKISYDIYITVSNNPSVLRVFISDIGMEVITNITATKDKRVILGREVQCSTIRDLS